MYWAGELRKRTLQLKRKGGADRCVEQVTVAGGEGDVKPGRFAPLHAFLTGFVVRKRRDRYPALVQRAAQVGHAAFDPAGMGRKEFSDMQDAHLAAPSRNPERLFFRQKVSCSLSSC